MKCRACVRLAVGPDAPAVPGHDALHEREPDAGAREVVLDGAGAGTRRTASPGSADRIPRRCRARSRRARARALMPPTSITGCSFFAVNLMAFESRLTQTCSKQAAVAVRLRHRAQPEFDLARRIRMIEPLVDVARAISTMSRSAASSALRPSRENASRSSISLPMRAASLRMIVELSSGLVVELRLVILGEQRRRSRRSRASARAGRATPNS